MWSDIEKISYIEGVVDFTEELGGNAERRLKGSCRNGLGTNNNV